MSTTTGTEPVARLNYSFTEAAQALGVSRAYMYNLHRAGRFDAHKLGGRRVIHADELHRLAREGCEPPPQPGGDDPEAA